MRPPKVTLFTALLLFCIYCNAGGSLKFVKNLNQFHPNVLYQAELNGGGLFLERNTLTYVFYNATDLDNVGEYLHECKYLDLENQIPVLRGHAYKVHLLNANANATITEAGKCPEYYNYFYGQDQSKWAGNVPLFTGINYQQIYPGIDLNIYSEGSNAKYDFAIQPHADVTTIALDFEGADGLRIENGNLLIKTSVGTITEQAPFAYQLINGEKKPVACNYELTGNTVTFSFPSGYNHRYRLVIDPVIVASTYSGTTYRAYAHAATYDNAGNIYSSGRAFSTNANGSGAGYPATTGAFQTTHHGGFQDICVSKYNPDGSALIWATYLGGSGQEQPHSLFVDANSQLYIFGSSNSGNYPVSLTGYQRTNPLDNFNNQLSDIVVTKLNATGSALLGSTYVGGNLESDGINWSSVERYYGDHFKGEIVVDSAGNAYVASYGRSSNFPVTAGAIQTTYGGGYQDGVLFKLNSDLSSLVWSTFYGGPLEDACYGLKLDAAGNLFVTGAISSNILTNTTGTIHTNYQGGLFDGFVAHIRADGQAVLKSTYFGSSNEEQAYLLDLDKNDNVYIFGASPNTGIQPTPNAYQGVLDGSFIAKLNPTLDSVRFVTTFNQMAPTALLIDECDYIYVVGHGGLNTSVGTLSGLPTTTGAFQTVRGGFYLMTLEPDATALKFASYYGPQDSHVDGGTCRFDKRGIIYHALCTDKDTLHTTPNAFHTTNLSNDFDNAVFKVDFQAGRVDANALATIQNSNDTSTQINSCDNPLAIRFVNRSVNAASYTWHFGNGDTSTAQHPLYTYSTNGTYQVMLVARDSATCNKTDTAYLTITTLGAVVSTTATNTTCNSSTGSVSANVTGSGSFAYLWSNGATSATVSNLASGVYSVTVTSGSCSVSASATVVSSNGVTLSATSTNTTCGNNNGTATVTTITGTTPFSYVWSNGATIAAPVNLAAGTYTVTVNDANSCSASASVTITQSSGSTATINSDAAIICAGDTAHICLTGTFTSYLWNNGQTGPCINATQAGNYYVTVTEAGGCTVESNHLSLSAYPSPPVSVSVNGDTLSVYNAISYQWFFNNSPIPNATFTTYVANQSGHYTVEVTDTNGCTSVSNPILVNVTGINNLTANIQIIVLPNPLDDKCELQISRYGFKQPLQLQLFDVTGRKVYEQKISSVTTLLNLSTLAKGVYWLSLDGANFSTGKKIIKQ